MYNPSSGIHIRFRLIRTAISLHPHRIAGPPFVFVAINLLYE